MSELYTDLDLKEYTLSQFVRQAKALQSTAAEDPTSWLKFVLTGEVTNDHQVTIDILQNRIDEQVGIEVLRDYDSLLGLVDNILVEGPISIYPLSPPHETLTSSVHLEKRIDRVRTLVML
jgi:hypothetical protein